MTISHYIGFDVHKKSISYCVKAADGRIVEAVSYTHLEILLADSGRRPDHSGIVYVLQGKERKKLIENLNQPYGLAMLNGYLYVGECDSVKRYKYDAKAMTAGPGEEVASLAGQGTHHWTLSLIHI